MMQHTVRTLHVMWEIHKKLFVELYLGYRGVKDLLMSALLAPLGNKGNETLIIYLT